MTSLRTWRFVYTSGVAAGLAVLFWAGMDVQRGMVLPNLSERVVGCVALAALALPWLRPRPQLYAFGGLCLSAALFILWLLRPGGQVWGTDSALPIGALMFLLFPLAWLLLASSISAWRVAALFYLFAGFAFLLALVLSTALSGGISVSTISWLLVLFVLNWPFYALVFVGTFGHTFA